MDSGGGTRCVDRCHRFCPPPPGLTAPFGGGGAPRATEEFLLDLVEGELAIRDADEPYALTNPTSIEGVNTDGALSDVELSTPTVVIEQDITSPVPAHVVIDAVFSQVAPGTGSINSAGEMVLQTSLTVDLHIEVEPPGGGQAFMTSDCTATPVHLTLESTSPYVDADGPGGEPGVVTVADKDFSVPPSVVEPDCLSLIQGAVDDQLAGPGHSLALTLEGDLTPPPPPGCASTAVMTASPAGESKLGDPVTLAATFTPDPLDPECIAADAASEEPTGFVDFLDDGRVIGTVTIEADFTAELSTTTLPAGERVFTTRYRGGGSYNPSEPSPGVSYKVAARPAISAAAPDYVVIGGDPVEFDVTVTNTGLGSAITNARLDLTLSRVNPQDISPERVKVDYQDADGNWVPVAFTPEYDDGLTVNQVMWGAVGPETGFLLAPGAEVTRPLRIQALTTGGGPPTAGACGATNETCGGSLDVTFELVQVDGAGQPAPTASPALDALTSATIRTMLVEDADRLASTVTFGNSFNGGPVSPHTVRQGSTIVLPGLTVNPQIGNERPRGFLEFAVDGEPVAVREVIGGGAPPEAPPVLEMPIQGTNAITVMIDLPLNVRAGDHAITVSYGGDPRYLPSRASATFTVVDAVGTPYVSVANAVTRIYECKIASDINWVFRAHVEAQALVPSVRPAGSDLTLDRMTLRMLFSRAHRMVDNARTTTIVPPNGTATVGVGDLTGVNLGFGPGGQGAATAIQRSNGTRMPNRPSSPPTTPTPLDDTYVFQGLTGTVALDGAPGEVVPVTLDQIQITGIGSLLPVAITCTPLEAPVKLGSVTLSGASLSVSPGGPIREGDEVTLSSTVTPVSGGAVEFLDGDETIGVVPVDAAGVASMVTDDLPAGTRSLTARYFGGALAPAMVSDPVELVVEATQCGEFAVEGHGATVRLVYLELLGRCPDQAGFDYWVGRLEGGLSPEAFARTIAATPEAVGRVVDDAYQTMLGRLADAAGRAFWVGQLSAHGRYDRLLADLGASDEFWALAGGTNEGFVTRVYERLLNRAPDQAGLDFWVGRLDAGTSRRALILSLANLDEPLGVLVVDSYDEILDRTPSSGERSDGIDHLRATGDRSGLYAELIGRSEFEDRAQEFPNTDS